jgi:hypothetical protein
MADRYILAGKRPVPCPFLLEWARWFETADRQVAESIQGDVRVSTVFLGLDHSFRDTGPPILFETMAFIGHDSVDCDRYATWEEAEQGHKNMVAKIFKATPILKLPTEEPTT